MKVAISCDYSGTELKDSVCKWMEEHGYEYIDCGSSAERRLEYVEAAIAGCEKVQSGECERAILICGTGIGISMAANKMKGIRAACCSDWYSAKYTRLHNDANALCFGARVIASGLACELVDVFLSTEFEGGRHTPRVRRVMDIENRR